MIPVKPMDVVRGEVAWHMDEIRKHFKKPVKVTVLVRRPGTPDGSEDFLLTDDDLSAVQRAIGTLEAQDKKGGDSAYENQSPNPQVFPPNPKE